MLQFDPFHLDLHYVAQQDYQEQDFWNNLSRCITVHFLKIILIFTIILCKLFNKIFLNNQSKGDCFSVIVFIINKLKDEMEVKYYAPIIVGFPFFPSFHFYQVNVQRYLRSFCTKSVRYESIQLRRSSWKKKPNLIYSI